GTRHRRGVNGTPVLVSDLLPLSVLSSGRSGRRRAEDRAEDSDPNDKLPLDDHPSANLADQPSVAEAHKTVHGPAGEDGTAAVGTRENGPAQDGLAMDGAGQDGHSPGHPQTGPMLSLAPLDRTSLSEPTVLDTGVNGAAAPDDLGGMARVSREFPVVGPPPAPTPRALEWGSNGSANGAEAAEVGMGDLLAEALAAFQESGHSLSAGTDASSAHSFDAVPGSGTWGQRRNWTSSVQLVTDPVDRRSSSAADALTDPELRLPDLTAEPLWQPPGTGRRSTAGD
ncbi:MAG: hypothetical protein ACRDRV_02545, partial [Pseudonocardiaceae bacterium]